MGDRPLYDRTDIRGRAVISTGVGLLAATFAIATVLYLYFQYVRHQQVSAPSGPVVNVRQLPPEPRQQVYPVRQYAAYTHGQLLTINSYGWVDRSNKVVRIPVQRAMEVALEQGLPQFESPSGVEYPVPRAGTLVTGFHGGQE